MSRDIGDTGDQPVPSQPGPTAARRPPGSPRYARGQRPRHVSTSCSAGSRPSSIFDVAPDVPTEGCRVDPKAR